MVKPIPYSDRNAKLSHKTIREFNLTKDDVKLSKSIHTHSKNHILQNKQMASKIRNFETMQKYFVKSSLKRDSDLNLKKIRKSLNTQQVIKRQNTIDSNRRWQEFRHRREKVVDEYVQSRKIQAMAQIIMRQYWLRYIFKQFNSNFQKSLRIRNIKQQILFSVLKIAARWRERCRKYGNNLDWIFRNKIRQSVSFQINIQYPYLRRQAIRIIDDFIQDNVMPDLTAQKIKDFIVKLNFIYKKMQRQILQKQGKVDVLLTYWDKMTGMLQQQASKIKDKNTVNLLRKIIMVPLNVKTYVFHQYVIQCKLRHNIAFMQWRYRFPTNVDHDQREL